MSHLILICAVCKIMYFYWHSNPIALRKAKIVCNFGLSECNRVKSFILFSLILLEIGAQVAQMI